jgi:hypothetical protein
MRSTARLATPAAISPRPTASPILAQGKAASAAAALGCGRKTIRRLKACPINQPNDAPALMKQAFSLPSIDHLFPQSLALG